MRQSCIVLAAAATFAWSGTPFAQTATTTSTTTTTTTTASNAGAYDNLSDGNKKIVSAIYESQLGSPNDTAHGTLLTRDDIAAMRQDTGWGNAYRQLQQQGYVTEKNLGQAISSYNHSTNASGGVTVVTTAGGEQITVGKGKSDNATASSAKSNNAANAGKSNNGKSTVVTTAVGSAGGTNAAATNNGKSTVVTTAAGSTTGANAAAAGVRAGGNGNGNGQPGGGKVK